MTLTRPYNFSAGPAALPAAVLQTAQQEMLDWHGCGMGVMEMSHRGAEFSEIADRAESALRQLANIPDCYHVLFLQGGACGQFSAVPLNLLRRSGRADYVITGSWSRKAAQEARRYGEISLAASAEDDGYRSIPDLADWRLDSEADYLHYTPNETIGGVEFGWVPEVGEVPLVADMSSCILSQPLQIERFGLVYAGAQKNIGPAGLTVVIVHEQLTDAAMPATPSIMDYAQQAKSGSMSNTPPTYGWYVAGLVFEWLLDQGGLDAVAETNRRKADKLYRAIDESDFYRNPIRMDCRSRMNVPFVLRDPGLDGSFLDQGREAGLLNLKGHRSVGGMRASLYNAMPESGVDALIEFMQDFEHRV